MTSVSEEVRGRIAAAFRETTSIRAAASLAGVGFDTARKYAPAMTPGVPMLLALNLIKMDPATQPRVAMHEPTVEEYAAFMSEGDEFPPPVVFFDGSDYWLGDGWHRVMAALRAGRDGAECDVRAGTKRDAILYSVGANAKHGLTRSTADKRRAVLTLMRDEEWSEQYSNREIARRCGVTHALTNKMRKELEAEGGRASAPAPTNGHVVKPSIPLVTPSSTTRPDDPPDVAEGRRNGTIPHDVDVEVTEPEPAGVDARPPSPAEPTDAEYLESLPARPFLSEPCRRRFDLEAIFHRRHAELRVKFERASKPMCNELKRAGNGHIGPYLAALYKWFRTYDPSRWVGCKDCTGTGQVPLIGKCPGCRGEGYRVY